MDLGEFQHSNHLRGHEFLWRLWIRVDFTGPVKRGFDMRTDVLCPNMEFKLRLMHELCGLLARSTEQQATT